MTDLTFETALNLATKFTRSILGDDDPARLCLTVCIPLSLYLTNHGFNNSIYQCINVDGRSHFVIICKDYPNDIIDPTIRQFDFTKPYVYAGPKPDSYSELELYCFTNTEYKRWRYPLHHNGDLDPSYYLPGNVPKPLEFEILLRLHTKAAAIITWVIKDNVCFSQPISCEMLDKYLEAVYMMILISSEDQIKLPDQSFQIEYDSLLLQAKKKSDWRYLDI